MLACKMCGKGISNPKQPSCKKRVRPSKRLWWKKMWNPRWRPRNGCDGRLMVKILITTIQVNLVPLGLGTKFTWIVVIKIFTINLPSQPFLGRHLGFHIFFHHSLSQGRSLFLQLGCFWLDFTSFCICIPQSRPMAGFGAFLTYLFSLPQEEEKDEEVFKYFN